MQIVVGEAHVQIVVGEAHVPPLLREPHAAPLQKENQNRATHGVAPTVERARATRHHEEKGACNAPPRYDFGSMARTS